MDCNFCQQKVISLHDKLMIEVCPKFKTIEIHCKQGDSWIGQIITMNYCPRCGREL